MVMRQGQRKGLRVLPGLDMGSSFLHACVCMSVHHTHRYVCIYIYTLMYPYTCALILQREINRKRERERDIYIDA